MFEEFDEKNKNLADEVKTNEEEHKFENVPDGTYEVKIDDMSLTMSKKNQPMLMVKFKILPKQKYAGRYIFMYKLCNTAPLINMVRGFLSSLTPKGDNHISIGYTTMTQLEEDIDALFTGIDGAYEYQLDVFTNDKGFTNYKITDIFAAEQPTVEESLPFES